MMRGTKRKWIARSLPWLLLVFALTLVISGVQRPELLPTLGVRWARIGSLAMVMTAIILTGGIDLSVASIIGLSSVVMGVLWQHGWSAESAALAALMVGFIAGGMNGTLVVVGLSPLVATLATLAFYSGLGMMISGASRITLDESALDLGKWAGLHSEYWILLLTFAVAFFVVHGTPFGRWCFAIGDNKLAAIFAGVPVNRTQWCLYAASGLVAALLAVIYTMRKGAIPDAHRGLELEVIACVVVGGTLITGGRGGVPQTLLGLAVMAHMDIGLTFLSSRVTYLTAEGRLVVIGAMLIAVAAWNEWIARENQKMVDEAT